MLNNSAYLKKTIASILETKLLSHLRLLEAPVFDDEDKENQSSGSAATDPLVGACLDVVT